MFIIIKTRIKMYHESTIQDPKTQVVRRTKVLKNAPIKPCDPIYDKCSADTCPLQNQYKNIVENSWQAEKELHVGSTTQPGKILL